jgi:hypothetical protein
MARTPVWVECPRSLVPWMTTQADIVADADIRG